MIDAARRRFLKMLGAAPVGDLADSQADVVRLRQKLTQKTQPVASGVPFTFGQFEYENQTNLVGSKKWATIDKMVADPHVKGGLLEKTNALQNAQWAIQPASDKPKDVEIADFVSANLLRTSSEKFGREYWCQTSWRQRLFEIIAALEHGFSMFQISSRLASGRGGTRRVWDRIHWLEPSSVDPTGWSLSDTDDFLGVYRTYSEASAQYRSTEWKYNELLPADEIALYTW